MSPALYAKAIVGALGAAITVLLGVIPPSTTLWIALTAAAAFLTALGVYTVPNRPLTAAPLSADGQAHVVTTAGDKGPETTPGTASKLG